MATGRMPWCMELGGRVLLDPHPLSGSYWGTAWSRSVLCLLAGGEFYISPGAGAGSSCHADLGWGGKWHERCPEVEFLLDFRAVHLRGQLLT